MDGGELLITEIFYAANLGTAGWFEVSNESGGDLDLDNLEFVLSDHER
ncbi:MAG: hypothetical protein H6740_14385 [Alphaproteobacteria bacterium]|nr:hypothetical protein [Alphaproteobacteria bacterium]